MSSSAEPQPGRMSGGWPLRRPTGVLAIDPVPLFREGLAALSALSLLAPARRARANDDAPERLTDSFARIEETSGSGRLNNRHRVAPSGFDRA